MTTCRRRLIILNEEGKNAMRSDVADRVLDSYKNPGSPAETLNMYYHKKDLAPERSLQKEPLMEAKSLDELFDDTNAYGERRR